MNPGTLKSILGLKHATSKDATHYHLGNILLVKHETTGTLDAVATDGLLLVKLGLNCPQTWDMLTAPETFLGPAEVALLEAQLKHGVVTSIPQAEPVKYPNWRIIIPNMETYMAGCTFGIDLELVERVRKAVKPSLGKRCNMVVRSKDSSSPIVFEGMNKEQADVLALIMPVRIS